MFRGFGRSLTAPEGLEAWRDRLMSSKTFVDIFNCQMKKEGCSIFHLGGGGNTVLDGNVGRQFVFNPNPYCSVSNFERFTLSPIWCNF